MLYEKLKKYGAGNALPMHMPGGKRKNITGAFQDAFFMDITEIEGFDDLHHPHGLLADEMKRYALKYGADETFILVNGSTSGILAAVAGSLKRGEKILIGRNVHISVINAIILGGFDPVYIYPVRDENGIYKKTESEDIRRKLKEEPTIRAVVITSPTYEGIVSDIKKIAGIVHEKDIPLIVDEAHGAHFAFSDYFPENACRLGADAVINSLHKTLPSLTQTGLLHLNGDIINKKRIKAYWDMLQTTSPSYVLMAGISACFDYLGSDEGKDRFDHYIKDLMSLRNRIKNDLDSISLFESDDISKIVLLTDDGKKLSDDLRDKYKIYTEMAASGYVIAMTSLSDSEKDYDRFFEALKETDTALTDADDIKCKENEMNGYVMKTKKMLPCEAFTASNNGEGVLEDISEAEGMCAAESVFIYPPGTPEIVAGEIYDRNTLKNIETAVRKGYDVIGVETDKDMKNIMLTILRD